VHKTVKQVALFGLFGVGNFGNEASLAAALFHIRATLPEIDLLCICADPQDVAERHAVQTVPITLIRYQQLEQSPNQLWRYFLRVLLEVDRWLKTYQFLRKVDLLIVPGTGILDDFGVGPFQMPYALFRWALAAKLSGAQLKFISIGAGPIHHPLSRWFMKFAAQCATYRSYRDQISKIFMTTIGLATQQDQIYPDLVFSLPRPTASKERQTPQQAPTIGLGLMAYYGWNNQAQTGEQIYQTYLAKLTRFALWLLERGYALRLLVGEVSDQRAVQDLTAAITAARGELAPEQLVAERIGSLPDLLRQIAVTDMVVATRFHNVLCALMMSKPVISLGYAQKNDVLMAEMGLGDYCQHIESFDVDCLIKHFIELEQKAPQFQAHMQQKNHEYCHALQQQYNAILSTV